MSRDEPWPYCPRTILRRQLARLRERGYVAKTGMEVEFFLVRKENGRIVVADPLDDGDRPCYDMQGLTRQYDFITTLSRYQTELGWDNYANDHEDGNGQFESNFTYDDALVTADRVVFFRYMVQAMAQQGGMLATFMPKPFGDRTGNGCHFHMSLWDARDRHQPVPRPAGPARARPFRAVLRLPGRAAGARRGLHRGDRADRELVQAATGAPRPRPARPGLPSTSPTAGTTAPR